MRRLQQQWRSKWLPAPKDEVPAKPFEVVVRADRIQVIATWIQVAMVAILTAGLFLTVNPTYQKERLAEDVARLTMSAERKVAIAAEQTRIADDARAEAQLYQARVLQARKDLDDLLTHAETLEARARQLDVERAQAFRALAEIRADHKRLVEAAEIAAWTIFVNELTMLASEGFRPRRLRWAMTEAQGLSFEEKLRGMLQVFDMHPWTAIQSAITKVSGTSMGALLADVADLGQFESRAISLLEGYEPHFECPKIDAESWMHAFNEYLSVESEMIDECVERSWINRADREEWSSARLSRLRQNTDFEGRQSAAFFSSCSANFRTQLIVQFTEPLSEAEAACSGRITDLVRILNGETPSEKIELSLAPPSLPIDLESFEKGR